MTVDTPDPLPQEPAASSSSPLDSKQRAEKEKEQGNVAFKTGKFQEAIEKYTRATGAFNTYNTREPRP